MDLKPINDLSDATYWATPNDFLLAANQSYTYMRTFADVVYDVVPNSNPVVQNYHTDYRSDILGAGNTFSRGQNSLMVTDAVYSRNYSRIRNINYMLDKAQAYPRPAEIAKYVAENKFFRAYLYFDLLQIYGGVPIILKPLAVDSPELQAPRNTRDEVTDLIISDLNAAIANLPTKAAQPAATELGRINKETAQAFLSRVALYEGTWQKFRNNTSRANTLLDAAVAASNAVIASNQYTLFGQTGTAAAILGDSAQKYLFILEDPQSNPKSITKTANNEYILANRYSSTLRQIRNNVGRQASQAGPTQNFANLYLCSDGLPIDRSPLFRGYGTIKSEYVNRDKRMRYSLRMPATAFWLGNALTTARVDWLGGAGDLAKATIITPSNSTGAGYGSQKWVQERFVTDNEESFDYPVIRYAEILLNYAEAVYERNGNISDADLDKSLNLVRQRVNRTMPKLSNALVSGNNLDMRTEIRRERTVELYHEGFRLDDLKRWKTAVDVLTQPLLSVRYTGTQYATLVPNLASAPKDALGNLIADPATNRQFSEKNYLTPIPTQEIQLNPQLQQNPGW